MGDGATEGDHVASAAKQWAALGNKKAADALVQDGPPFPEPLDYLWAWFLKHSMGLAPAGEGFPVITWEGLAAWCGQMRIDLEPWEADVLLTLSVVRANIRSDQRAAQLKAAAQK